MFRKCKNCGEEKKLTDFVLGQNYKGKQYYRHKCKECLNKKLRTGKINTGRFLKGHKLSIGKKHTEESKKKISDIQLGRKQNPDSIEKRRQKHLGQRRKETRHSSRKYWDWRDSVKKRDNWTCQHCGSKEKEKMHAHHIVPWTENKELRFEVSNGLTLCKNCHAKFETKEKKGKSFSKSTEFKKGQAPWNKGKKINGIHKNI